MSLGTVNHVLQLFWESWVSPRDVVDKNKWINCDRRAKPLNKWIFYVFKHELGTFQWLVSQFVSFSWQYYLIPSCLYRNRKLGLTLCSRLSCLKMIRFTTFTTLLFVTWPLFCAINIFHGQWNNPPAHVELQSLRNNFQLYFSLCFWNLTLFLSHINK